MKHKLLVLGILMLVSVIAACPPGCEQRESYCDCLSNATSVLTNCTSDLNCEEGYVCVNGVCVLAGEVMGAHVTIPEFSSIFLALVLFMAFVAAYSRTRG